MTNLTCFLVVLFFHFWSWIFKNWQTIWTFSIFSMINSNPLKWVSCTKFYIIIFSTNLFSLSFWIYGIKTKHLLVTTVTSQNQNCCIPKLEVFRLLRGLCKGYLFALGSYDPRLVQNQNQQTGIEQLLSSLYWHDRKLIESMDGDSGVGDYSL